MFRLRAKSVTATILAFGALGFLGAAGLRCSAKTAAQKAARAPEPVLTPVPVGQGALQMKHADTGQTRLLLDDRAKAVLRRAADQRSKPFALALQRCEALLAKPVGGGYQGFDWANATASLALCWQATSDERFAQGAVGYLSALVDDRVKVGDAKGGTAICAHDNGYGIRTYGAYAALGYDWLRNAPGMTPELKRRIVSHLDGWLTWYGDKGYLNDNPISNYFWGYLTTLTFAGLAFHGDVPEADAWLDKSRDLLSKRVLPTFKAKLKGGYWPEGWQYGEYTAVEIALVAQAFKTAAGVDIVRQLPWLSDTVTYHVHALAPDRATVYDGGTWTARPTKPSALAMSAVAVVLEGVDAQKASEARWLVRNALPPITGDQAWIGLLMDRPDAKATEPYRSERTSFHPAGASLTFARSDWSPSATWFSFQAGPRLAEDHQHKDEGHIGLWRGSDALLVDGGGGEGDATINHNTILIDDGGRCMTYTPNQGVFGKNVKTTHFADDGQVAVVVGDIGEAYAPACAREGCSERAVSKLERTVVYLRPSVLVVRDELALTKESDGAIWAAHVTSAPSLSGKSVSSVVGASRVSIQSLLPAGAALEVRKEPTESGSGIHRKNQPWGPMWRIEIQTPKDGRERTLLNYITADDANAPQASAETVSGKGLVGAVGTIAGKKQAILFATHESGGNANLSKGVSTAVVAGLTPSKRYRTRASAERGCSFEIRPAADGNATANAGGFVNIKTPECENRQ